MASTNKNAPAAAAEESFSFDIDFKARDLPTMVNSPELLEKHTKATEGKIITRFPPEPNGYLHIGHAKAMFLDYGYANHKGGHCIMRFDDTNPEAEKQEYIDNILDDVKWLGHQWWKVTYSSDYFDQLHAFAVELIKKGKAYVCHQTKEEITKGREEKADSPWRNRPIEENLKLFEDMRKGKIMQGEATLRMKIDNQHPNPCMWDPIAYRIRFVPHARSGDEWCIYPSYDFTHCLVDSIENVTHSLCTTEFEIRRDSYYWLLDALDVYRPYVWEFSRMNITGTVLSKSKLLRLIKGGYVRGWDDARLPTIKGLRRRGFVPNAIHNFCKLSGISRAEINLDYKLLEHCLRQELDLTANRAFAVFNPLKVTITDLKEPMEVKLPNHPKDEARGERTMHLHPTFYLSSDDFRLVDSKDYYGLAPNKSVILRYAGLVVKCEDVVLDKEGNPVELKVSSVPVAEFQGKKPKGVLHWLSCAEGEVLPKAEVRLYDRLFKSDAPAELSGEDFLRDFNTESEVVLKDCLLEPSLRGQPVGTTYQFERLGYFCVDKDSTEENMVFNRTITLKESAEKQRLK